MFESVWHPLTRQCKAHESVNLGPENEQVRRVGFPRLLLERIPDPEDEWQAHSIIQDGDHGV